MAVVNRIRRVATAVAVTVAALAVSATPASAGSAARDVSSRAAQPVVCTVGFVCLQAGYNVIRVPEGERRSFPLGVLISSATNLTRINYCVTGNPSFLLRPGASVVRSQRVIAVAPGNFCLA